MAKILNDCANLGCLINDHFCNKVVIKQTRDDESEE